MFTQAITFLIIFAVIGCILYGRKLLKTEKIDAVFGNPERANGGVHWVIVGSSIILLTWLYYSWDIAKGFYPKSANELCQVAKVNDSLLSLKYLFPIEERQFKSTYIIETENKNIDAVCIATPDHWHSVITISALQNGKDVYCEKPLTHNIHESTEVIKAVKQNNRVLQTGSMQRSSSEFRIACELVRNGVIGKIRNVDISVGDPGRPCDLKKENMEPGLNWDLWCGPGPLREYSSVLCPRGIHNHFPAWRNYMEYGGGMITDWGAHHIDIAQWGLGTDDSGPVEARPPEKWEKWKSKRGAQLVYSNGTTITHKNGFGVHFQGEDGEVKVNRGRFVFIHKGKEIAKFEKREDGSLGSALQTAEKTFLKDGKIKLYKSNHHIRDFLSSIETREKPITNEIVGGRSAICCHLMNQSYYNGEAIKWDPKTNKFSEKSGNPKWLTRNYRGIWKV